VASLSVLRFIPIGVFDDATVRSIGRAFDAACKELKDTGQPDVVHEVMVKRIIAAARKGERNVTRLRDAADWPKKAKKRNSWIKGEASHPLLSGHVAGAWFPQPDTCRAPARALCRARAPWFHGIGRLGGGTPDFS
jgi:hypothetical protein